MDQIWINKKQNPTCILFFNGWGMDAKAIEHIDTEGFDVCMFYNYRRIESITDNFKNYQKVIIIAWSLGVWAAEQAIFLSDVTIHKSLAINGTSCPVHDQYGIPNRVFDMTLQGWNETSRVKFNRRMMGGDKNLYDCEKFLSGRSAIDQKEELQAIYSAYNKNHNHPINWDAALVGMNDLVFPVSNQLNWWTGKAKITETNRPHFPFTELKCWDQLILF
jgi:biotin synthesis protein BioG